MLFFFFQAEDGIRDVAVTGVQTCALPIYLERRTSSLKQVARFNEGGQMRLRIVIAIVCVAGSCSLLLEAGKQGSPPQKEITYSKDVAPILYKKIGRAHV